MSESDHRKRIVQRLTDLGVLKFVKESDDYNRIIYKGQRVLSLIDSYLDSFNSKNETRRKELLNEMLAECNDTDHKVTDYLLEKITGKDYVSLFHMKQRGEI